MKPSETPAGAAVNPHPRGESDPVVTQDLAPAGDFPSDDLLAFSITEALGERCDDFNQDCYTCQAWQQYDRLTASSPAEVSEEELARWLHANAFAMVDAVMSPAKKESMIPLARALRAQYIIGRRV